MNLFRVLLLLTLCHVSKLWLHAFPGEQQWVCFEEAEGTFPILRGKKATPILIGSKDSFGVLRVAGDLASDVEWVGGTRPVVGSAAPVSEQLVIIGSLGNCDFIDRLVADGRLDVSAIRGKWESWLMEVVENPFPGVRRALVIAGSDKRGAIYGTYFLSEQMGVSPWHWWADVPVTPRQEIHVKPGRFVQGPPTVRYRGIFINDEAPVLTGWAAKRYGHVKPQALPPIPAGVVNLGREFHARVFELLLRLRANYLWPAMWNNAFNEDDPANAVLADQYGIVMGTSHQEPMMRAQKEWDRRFQAKLGSWNYAKHPRLLEEFWREGVRRNHSFENVYTLGLRGANDTEMAPGGPAANRSMLESIISTQRRILKEEVNSDLTQVPQLWCLYKEVQEYHEAGMRVPDDVTLLWADDNWGNLRRLPSAAERSRPGGAGVYYHFDYVGGPRSYKWTDTNPIPKIWEQMSLAARGGADRLWIVNVGDLKGFEHPLEFFLSMAWDTKRWNGENLSEYARARAAREFGPEFADEIAELLEAAGRASGRRKPEMLAPDTYSLVNYAEAERVSNEYRQLVAKAESLQERLPAWRREAFYQLLVFPLKSCAIVQALYHAAGRNALYARQGRAAAAHEMERLTRSLFETDRALARFFNKKFANGRWDHFADQPHLGYTSWNSPKEDNLDHIKLQVPPIPEKAALGLAIDGSVESWPGSSARPTLPGFDSLNQQESYFEVFNRGAQPFDFKVSSSHPWLRCSDLGGPVGLGRRVRVSLDWPSVPTGSMMAELVVEGAGERIHISVPVIKPADITRDTLRGFAEGQGVVCIEPEHFSSNTEVEGSGWRLIKGYGRTLSGLRAEGRWDSPGFEPGKGAPRLEYPLYLHGDGSLTVHLVLGPVMNFMPSRTLRIAVAVDDGKPQVLVVVPGDYQVSNSNQDWGRVVAENARVVRGKLRVDKAGYHTLKIWMMDPGPVLQRILVDRGGLRTSYLGPVESYRGQ